MPGISSKLEVRTIRYCCRRDELKIREIKIREFKNLREFEARFDTKSLATVLLGQNGTGKSNLLEAMVVIFRDLDLGETHAQ